MRRCIRHRGRSADPEALGSNLYSVVENPSEADESRGSSNVLLEELHHIGATGDVLDGCIIAAGLGAESEGGVEIARTLECERMHRSPSTHRADDLGRVLVATGQDLRQCLEHRRLRAHVAEHRRELAADRPAADHDRGLGHAVA